jgi:hypothetical protein
MNPIEERIKHWRSLVDHPRYKQFNLVLAELIFRIIHKRNWRRQTLEDVSGFYL